MSTPLPPGRVSIQDVEHALLLEYQRTHDPRWVQLTRGALRNLKTRRRISPGPGFDVLELTRYLDARHAKPEPQPCEIDGCDQPKVAKECCVKHYRRLQKHGDPHVASTRNPDDVGYAGVHGRLRTQRGRATEHECADCSGQAAEWAYDHGDPDERVDERNGPYSVDPDRYRPLCRSCHHRFDAPFRAA